MKKYEGPKVDVIELKINSMICQSMATDSTFEVLEDPQDLIWS